MKPQSEMCVFYNLPQWHQDEMLKHEKLDFKKQKKDQRQRVKFEQEKI